MNQIKIGACDWGLPGAGLHAAEIAAEAGLDALSLRIGLYENDYPLTQPDMQKLYLRDQDRYGIEYCAIALNDFDNIPMHAREHTREYDIVWNLLGRAVSTARALRVPIIQVPGFGASEIKTEEDLEYSVKAFRYLCDAAGEYDIKVASENLMNGKEFKSMYERINRDNFYLYFDSQNYHLYRNYDEIDILTDLYPYMCDQIHVKDGLGALSGAPLGDGDSEFYATMEWLGTHNYTGYILLENYYDQFPLRTYAENPFDLLHQDVQRLKEVLQSRSFTGNV